MNFLKLKINRYLKTFSKKFRNSPTELSKVNYSISTENYGICLVLNEENNKAGIIFHEKSWKVNLYYDGTFMEFDSFINRTTKEIDPPEFAKNMMFKAIEENYNFFIEELSKKEKSFWI